MAAGDVEGVLERIRALFGTGSPPPWPPRTFGESISPVASWSGDASDRAHEASRRLDTQRQLLADTHAAVGPLLAVLPRQVG